LISENVSALSNKENTLEILIDLYLNKNLFATSIDALNKNSMNISNQNQITNNLLAKLYMISKSRFAKIDYFNSKFSNQNKFILKVRLLI